MAEEAQASFLESSPPSEALSPTEELFEKYRKLAGVILAPAMFFLTWFLVGHYSSLKYEGRMLSAILAAVGVLWVTETVPLPVTALLGAVLCVVLRVGEVKAVLAPFADPIVFLFIGSFILARSMTVHALDRRIALSFLSLPGISSRPALLLAGLGFVTGVLSMWVSNTATTAMMLPIGLGILSALHQVRVDAGLSSGPMDARRWPFATGMMLMIAYAASIGGIGTPVGSPPNLIGISHLRASNVNITFFKWMQVTVPLLALMGLALFVILYLLHPAPKQLVQAAFSPGRSGGGGGIADYLRREKTALGGWSRGQRNTLVAFIFAIVLWMTPGFISLAAQGADQASGIRQVQLFFENALPEAIVALLAAILLFVLPINIREGEFTMTWREAAKIDWGTILLFGGGLSLGALMNSTGVAKAMGSGVIGQVGASGIWVLTGAAIAIGIFLSETTSNTAAASMLVPVVISLAKAAGVSPVPPVLGAVLGASYGFMLPVSTPPNAIVYGSGLVPIPRMIRAGIIFDILGFFIIWAGLWLLCPRLGLM